MNQKMDFKKTCEAFFSLPPAQFIALVKSFMVSQIAAVINAPAPIIHADEVPPLLEMIDAFEKNALEHAELYDNWLCFAIMNCKDCPRVLLIQDDISNPDAMTCLTSALLPNGSSTRRPYLNALKKEIQEYIKTYH